ncbi:MAG TPA: hypothetical protein VMU68_03170 [Acidimicrobiales bacterium]|nr:hypothetical protein [Acidimicrobiales bacterium]
MVENLPRSIVDTLTGYPEVGVPDIMIPLLTVDERGYPHVCLLSRAELNADTNHIYAVVASSVSKSNILRDRRATLIVFTRSAAYYSKLDAALLKEDGHLLGVVFTLHSIKEDGDESFHMEVPRYLPTEAIALMEHWEQSRSLLGELLTQGAEEQHG